MKIKINKFFIAGLFIAYSITGFAKVTTACVDNQLPTPIDDPTTNNFVNAVIGYCQTGDGSCDGLDMFEKAGAIYNLYPGNKRCLILNALTKTNTDPTHPMVKFVISARSYPTIACMGRENTVYGNETLTATITTDGNKNLFCEIKRS